MASIIFLGRGTYSSCSWIPSKRMAVCEPAELTGSGGRHGRPSRGMTVGSRGGGAIQDPHSKLHAPHRTGADH